jgi:hypothetical protein
MATVLSIREQNKKATNVSGI